MKTTLNINDQLLADAKALAAQQRTSLTRLIEEGLQLRLRAKVNSAKGGRLPLPVFKGLGGLVHGWSPARKSSSRPPRSKTRLRLSTPSWLHLACS
jgi:hypothetical protein